MSSSEQTAFPRLSSDQLDRLLEHGTVRPVRAGEVLFSEGDRDFDFFVVLEGDVEIVENSSGTPRQVTVHQPGEFTGDVDMLTDRRTVVTARAVDDGKILAIPREELRAVMGRQADLGEILLSAFLMRRTLLLDSGFEGLRIIGSRFSPSAHELRDFATRNAVPFTWLDVEREPAAERLLRDFGVRTEETPVVIGRGGELLRNPTLSDLAELVGLDAGADRSRVFDLVVVGVGPAGLAAAVYAASEGLDVLALERMAVGGQAGTSTRIENYLGFPAGISGGELTRNGMLQAQKFGAKITVPARAERLSTRGSLRAVHLEDGTDVLGRCVLVASGAEYRRLPAEGLERFEGAGVYYAATESEARLCGDEEVGVIGGGNSAGQAAVFLSRIARRVHVVIRGDDLGKSMSRYLVDRLEQTPNVVIHRERTVSTLEGGDHLDRVRLAGGDGGEEALELSALFVFIGAAPHTDWLSGCVRLDRNGFVLTGSEALQPGAGHGSGLVDGAASFSRLGRGPFLLETSLPGVFAAGDVRSGSVKRVASAVGEGSMAISFVHRHIGASA